MDPNGRRALVLGGTSGIGLAAARRLVEKGALKTKQVGNSFLYSTTRSPLRTLRRSGEELILRAGETAVGPLLAHLVKRSRLSSTDLDELRALIEEKSEEEDA